jgi:glycosyltransferase involved in cell wall biosynthesis
MGKLGIPFIFGPVGGGERAPFALRKGYGFIGSVLELVRDAANVAIRVSPAMHQTFSSAHRIYVTSAETMALVPPRYRSKARIELAIASDHGERACTDAPAAKLSNGTFRVLYAGRFVDYKGMHLGLPAFARLAKDCPGARLTLVGSGPAETRWRSMAKAMGIEKRVDWHPWQSGDAMPSVYRRHDVLLFPSLHDSGGFVVLEAMRQGLPVVCLKLGGPATLVDESCGRAIPSQRRSSSEVIGSLAAALVELSLEPVRQRLADGARARGDQFSWQQKVERIYGAGA